MTDQERIDALATALHLTTGSCYLDDTNCMARHEEDAAAVLAVLDGWTLVRKSDLAQYEANAEQDIRWLNAYAETDNEHRTEVARLRAALADIADGQATVSDWDGWRNVRRLQDIAQDALIARAALAQSEGDHE